MSQWRGRLEDTPELESAADWAADNYHVPVVALLLAFMLWSRLRSWQNFVVDGQVVFRGNDPYYHYRSVSYTVRNWPATMPFDPWTYFPYGNASGQFGTLFDQIVATVALVVGLGSPSDHTVAMTLLVAPAFFGAAAGIPTYVIGRRLGGRTGGVVAVTVLAFSVGAFFSRSLAGFPDHHVAEALFQTVGILGVMVAVSVANREKPIYEQLVERDFEALRPTLVWSALAGVAITLYLWTWPFGVLLIGIVGVFLFVQLNLEVLRGESPEHTAFAGAAALGVTGITVLTAFETATITASDFSLLHPLLAFGVAGGCVFMAWLAREWEDRGLDSRTYPAATVGIVVVIALLTMLLAPGLFEYFANQIQRIMGLGFTTSGTAGTVAEVQPLVNWEREGLNVGVQRLFDSYGFALFIALAGAATIAVRELLGRDVPAEQLLVVVWAVFMTATTFTQARFQYYLVFPVAVLTGYVVSRVVAQLDLDRGLSEVGAYQALTVLAIAILVVAPLAPTAIGAGQHHGPGQDPVAWNDGLDWMQENTPETGAYGVGGNGSLEYYGTYEKAPDHDYEEGSYGVLSWWDYGHWITVMGERVPLANPFQQGARTAANFLLAPNETQANAVLDEVDEDDAKTRYVAVDYKMVDPYSNFDGKFFAPSQFYTEDDVSVGDYTQRVYYDVDRGAYFRLQSQAYYNSTVVRLYHFHGSAVEPEPYVVDWSLQSVEGGFSVPAVPPEEPNSTTVRQYDSMEEARTHVEEDPTSRIGGFGGIPSQRVPAMEHYRLVGASEQVASQNGNYDRGLLSTARGVFGSGATSLERSAGDCGTDVVLPVSTNQGTAYLCLSQQGKAFLQPTEQRWTKIFERVPGATVEGTGPANATVGASVEMRMPGSDETFTYRQRARTDDDGQFTMTVPYSTTGYEEWGPEQGHTNVSVRANGGYQFRAVDQAENGTVYAWNATVDVPEERVIGADDSPVSVEMDRSVFYDPDQQNGSANETDGTQG